MAVDIIKGENYEYNNGKVRFFGAEGMPAGRNWVVNWLFGVAVEVAPETDLPDRIQNCIDDDVKAGNGDKIAMVQVLPNQAVILFLMNVITRERLKGATETEEYIDIPRCQFGERFLTVRVLKEGKHECATADADGNIL